MAECELCGATEGIFLNHYERHIEPPRVLNICRACHGKLDGHRPNKGPNFIVKVFSVGNSSHVLTFPAELRRRLGEIAERYAVYIRRRDGCVLYKPLRGKKK